MSRAVPVVFAVLFILMVSCGGKKNKIPSSIMSKEKMEAVMWDMMQADQYLTDFVFNHDASLDRLEKSTTYYQQILDLHKTTKEEFKRSFIYYRDRPALLKEVLDSLSSRTTVEEVSPLPPVKVDSVFEKKKRSKMKPLPLQ